MTALESKILSALEAHESWMAQYDRDRKAEYDEYMAKAAQQKDDYWKKDFEGQAEWALHFQKHGYDFLTGWKNIISKAVYGRIYEEWHSAQAGRYKGTGHGAFTTTELEEAEIKKINIILENLIKKGYLRLSKSGKMARYIHKN